jgi:hypothetical protein
MPRIGTRFSDADRSELPPNWRFSRSRRNLQRVCMLLPVLHDATAVNRVLRGKSPPQARPTDRPAQIYAVAEQTEITAVTTRQRAWALESGYDCQSCNSMIDQSISSAIAGRPNVDRRTSRLLGRVHRKSKLKAYVSPILSQHRRSDPAVTNIAGTASPRGCARSRPSPPDLPAGGCPAPAGWSCALRVGAIDPRVRNRSARGVSPG